MVECESSAVETDMGRGAGNEQAVWPVALPFFENNTQCWFIGMPRILQSHIVTTIFSVQLYIL